MLMYELEYYSFAQLNCKLTKEVYHQTVRQKQKYGKLVTSEIKLAN